MNVVLNSMFRNSQHTIPRFFSRIEALEDMLRRSGHVLSLNLAFGDSRDETGDMLVEACKPYLAIVQEVNHGGKEYGSLVNADRFANLARVCNALWSRLPDNANSVVYLESDLIWEADTIAQLVRNHEIVSNVSSNFHEHMVLAPMVYTQTGSFYDTWAFRKQGAMFTPEAPYHPSIQDDDRLIEVDSVGSVFCMDAPLAFKLTWPEEDVIVGLCRFAKRAGARIFVDKMLRVYHP